MSIFELFVLAVGLSMDAFAVAICKGLATRQLRPRHMLTVGAWFGGFQAIMPLIGYFVGTAFAKYVTAIDHWIALVLLCGIGGNMIKESFEKEEEEQCDSYGFKTMLLMAIATSIDALAAGISLAMDLKGNNTYAFIAVAFIGVITFTLSAVGVKIGNIYGAKFKSKAEFAGGLILILLGVKILLEHLGVINF
ncbi:MAG: manganese efflux pump [Ruminococcaceae bacterium]|nr:manganese efflux pump [Oscillospiraceae bacterium]